jgi:hypothetical protein
MYPKNYCSVTFVGRIVHQTYRRYETAALSLVIVVGRETGSAMTSVRSDARLQYSLDEITRLLEKHRVLEGLGCIEPDTVSFDPSDRVYQAVNAFERYDLVSAPVIDDRGKLVGRLTVDAVMDSCGRNQIFVR